MTNNNQLVITYNNSQIKSLSAQDQEFQLNTKGKFLPYDLDISATIETPLIDDTNAAAGDILSSYTAYINDNEKVTGTVPTFAGSVTVIQNTTFTIDGVSYTVSTGTTWAEWVADNSDNFEIIMPNDSRQYEIIDKTKSTITQSTSSSPRICNGTFYYFKASTDINYHSVTTIQNETITTAINYGTGAMPK